MRYSGEFKAGQNLNLKHTVGGFQVQERLPNLNGAEDALGLVRPHVIKTLILLIKTLIRD
jgi:hypothetical protein